MSVNVVSVVEFLAQKVKETKVCHVSDVTWVYISVREFVNRPNE